MEEDMRKVEITFRKPISIKVPYSENREQFIDDMKGAIITTLMEMLDKKEFPAIAYAISEPDTLTARSVKCGDIVEHIDGKLGIVTKVNPKSVRLVLEDGSVVVTQAHALKSSDRVFESKAVFVPREGCVGYLESQGKMYHVVLGERGTKNYVAYIIGGKGNGFRIPIHVVHIKIIKQIL